ncbi:MAG: NUDIX hydrolase [Planctomycetota bacterium]
MKPAGGLKQAIVAVVRRQGRVLVILRGPQARRAGHWGLLTGTIEPGEPQAAAVVREVREEVGLAVAAQAKVWESQTDDGAYQLHWWTVAELGAALRGEHAAHSADARPAPLTLAAGEVSEVRWVTAAEFLQLAPTFAGDRDFFARVLPTLR